MKSLLALSLMLLFTAGCASQVPIAVNPPISKQYKAKSTHHWDILAEDVARETCALLDRDPKKDGQLQGKPFYIVPAKESSTFDKAFRNLLITRMVNRGMPVSTERGGIEVQYETQLIRHNSAGYGHLPGTLTALSAGVFVVRELVEGSFAAVPGAIGLAALADWGAGKFSTPTPTELMVTTSIAIEKKFVYRKSAIYYIDTEEAELYQGVESDGAAGAGLKRLEVVGR